MGRQCVRISDATEDDKCKDAITRVLLLWAITVNWLSKPWSPLHKAVIRWWAGTAVLSQVHSNV